jgi:subtilisin family serine protease
MGGYGAVRVGTLVVAAALAMAALPAAAHAAPLTPAAPAGKLVTRPAASAIADSYIVVFKDRPSIRTKGRVAKTARELAARHRGQLRHTYGSAVRGFSVTLSEANARELAADPRVAFVEQDGRVRVSATQTNAEWGLDRIDQRALPLNGGYRYGPPTNNVSAYLIDTGILTTHTEFGGRARHGFDFVDGDGDATDCHGHGTHVAGTLGGATFGVAKDVTLYSLRVFDCTGTGTWAGVISAVDWVTANATKPAVANMSLSGGPSDALDAAVARSVAAGITYVVAAGNDNADACGTSPARVPGAITVGATTSTDSRASYSNYGACLDMFAPGSSVTSASSTGTSARATRSGTSMAAPHVAGAAALYLGANPLATPVEVAGALARAATRDIVTNPGAASPNMLLYVDGSASPSALRAAPALTSTNGGLDLFWGEGNANAVRHQRYRNGSWRTPTSLGGVWATGPGAAAEAKTGKVVVAAVKANGTVWIRSLSAGTWSAWSSLGGRTSGASQPAVASLGAGAFAVVIRGSGDAAFARFLRGGKWGPWTSLGGTLSSPPAAAGLPGGSLLVAAVGADSSVSVKTVSAGGAQSPWSSAGGGTTTTPGLAVDSASGTWNLFLRGSDGAARHRAYDPASASWNAWSSLGGTLSSGPGAAASGVGRLDIVGFGADGRLMQNSASAGAWSGFRALTRG